MKGLRGVINTLLKIGTHFKSVEEMQDSPDYNIVNKRKIRLPPHFKPTITQIGIVHDLEINY